jgi:hypothetical protein
MKLTSDPLKTLHQKRWAVLLACLGGMFSFIGLWALTWIESLDGLLGAPLVLINKGSWAIVGWKLIPDGGPSTLFVSFYFALIGATAGYLIGLLVMKSRGGRRYTE